MTYIAANTTVQGAIKELDSAIATVSVGASYWTRTGSYLYPTTITDSIGIGTTAPTASLAVVGDASISGSFVTRGATPTFDILNGGNLTFQTSVGGDTGLVAKMILLNNGNVGIGTTAPVALLETNSSSGLQSENLTNGALTSGTSWTQTGDMALAGNAATYTHSSGVGTYLKPPLPWQLQVIPTAFILLPILLVEFPDCSNCRYHHRFRHYRPNPDHQQ